MKCISLKTFLLILSIILIFAVLITFFLTYHHYKIKNNNVNVDEINNITNDDTKLEENNINNNLKNEFEFLIAKYNEKKLIALTFDDGPSKYTHNLIDELNKRNINVTFFVLGENITKYSDTLKFAIDSGNEIGIHSYKHKLFTKLSETEIKEQITLTRSCINEISDIDIFLCRVPYGSINKKVENVLNNENLTNILWDVDSLDWKFKNKTKTYNYVMKKIKGNDIILMHDTFKSSVEASLDLIDTLSAKGYIFVTISKYDEIKNNFSNNITES